MFLRAVGKIQNVFPFLQSPHSLFEQTFLYLPIPLCLTDTYGVIQYTNHAFSALTGYKPEELIGCNMSILQSPKNEYGFFKHFWQQLNSEKKFNGHIWNRYKDGRYGLHDVTITQIQMNELYYLSTHVDITEEIKLKERQHYLAYHDPLTGLANRALLEDRLEHAIDNCRRTGDSVGIIFCDLNEFKQINDNFGHKMGDHVLEKVANVLQQLFRTNDTVARYGGDEFVIVVEHIKESSELVSIVNQLKEKIVSISMSKYDFSISASIGTASFPSDGLTKEQLLNIADSKMYDAKNQFYGLVG